MKDEIKKIIDNLSNESYYSNFITSQYGGPNYYYLLEKDEGKILLDYITNLQEKVNQYENPDDMTLMSMWCDEKAKDKIKQLQEEYEKEHYLVDKLTRQLTDEYKNTEYQCKEKEDYKSRNEKANWWLKEMLKQAKSEEAKAIINGTLDLLLQGSEEE